MLENSEPQAGARPIGTRVWGKNRQASKTQAERSGCWMPQSGLVCEAD